MGLKIGVVGAGAIGGFLTARLEASGTPVHVLARNRTRDALIENGLTLVSEADRITVRPAMVSADPAEIGPVDICVFTVKGQDTEQAADAMRPMIGDHTRILSFQNGLFGVETLARLFGARHVLAGVTYVPASVQEPGVVRHTGAVTRFVFGPLVADSACSAAREMAAAGQAAGLDMACLDDPMPEIWAKMALLTPFHLVSAMTRRALGDWIDVPETRALYHQGMQEVVAVAQARGVRFSEDIVARNMAFSVHTADRRTRASMLDDIEQGRPLELDATVGWLIAQARQLGIPAPMHEFGYGAIKPLVNGADQVA